MISSLHVITSDARRGAETFAVQLAASLQVGGNRAEVVALTRSGGVAPHDVEIMGKLRRSPSTLASVRRRAREFDVVVAHGSSTLEACATSLVGTGVPFIYRTIGDPLHWTRGAARRLWVGGLLHRAARLVALYPEAASALARRYRLDRNQIEVIPNAVDERNFPRASTEDRLTARRELGLELNGVYLAYVGALSPEKNVETAMRSLERILDCTLLVAGDGPERERLHQFGIHHRGLDVRFLGSVPEPWSVYAAADLLLLPSRTEGMPAVVIEAGLVGTPSVATTVGALPSMIVDGETGFLAPANDDDAFIRRVRDALASIDQPSRNISGDFRHRYSMTQVARAWLATIQSVARTRHGYEADP